MPAKKKLSFEDALKQLDQTVKQMESGELSLDESLKAFEGGIALVRDCQAQLDSAEQKIQTLIANSDGTFSTEDFKAED